MHSWHGCWTAVLKFHLVTWSVLIDSVLHHIASQPLLKGLVSGTAVNWESNSGSHEKTVARSWCWLREYVNCFARKMHHGWMPVEERQDSLSSKKAANFPQPADFRLTEPNCLMRQINICYFLKKWAKSQLPRSRASWLKIIKTVST